ncbi:Gfo/Idh/MocA family protein [Halomicrococcus sp. SG-WS-1]|uniref:Gfo/Idh/MocA family protein n=1 Tax=Halomicrococcus sp. SG-WS-1 TaxID=3439057 RepID=UPI003F7A4288
MVGMGAIGLGGLGHLMLDAYAEIEDVDLVAGTDVSPKAREAFETGYDAPAYDDYEAMLDDHGDALDAVTIVTPHTLHYEQAMDCLRADLDVLLEKPMVTDVDDAVDLVEAVDERDRVLQVGYQRHFHPGFRELRRIVTSGRIGGVHTVNCYLGQDWIDVQRGTWRTNPDLSGGGQLYDTGSHMLDAMLWTTATTPTSVVAEMEYAKPGVDCNSALGVALDAGDRTATASVGLTGDGVDMTPSEGYVVWGTHGQVSYSDDRLVVAEGGQTTAVTTVTADTDFGTLTRAKLVNFVDAVQGEDDPAVPAEYGLQVTALTEAAYEADETGRRVDVTAMLDAAREAE